MNTRKLNARGFEVYDVDDFSTGEGVRTTLTPLENGSLEVRHYRRKWLSDEYHLCETETLKMYEHPGNGL